MPRNFLIQIKVSEDEKAQVQADAERMNQNVSEYARSLLLHERATTRPAKTLPELQQVERMNERPIPDAAPTVGPSDPLPDRPYDSPEVQTKVHEGFVDQEQEFERRVNRHALRMPRRKAEAIVKKEMGL